MLGAGPTSMERCFFLTSTFIKLIRRVKFDQ